MNYRRSNYENQKKKEVEKDLELNGCIYKNGKYIEKTLKFKRSQACMYSGILQGERERGMFEGERQNKILRLIDYKMQEITKMLTRINYHVFISQGDYIGHRGFFNIVDELKYIMPNMRHRIKNIVFFKDRNEFENSLNFKDVSKDADLIVFTDEYNKKGIDSLFFKEFLMMNYSKFMVSVSSYTINSVANHTLQNAPVMKVQRVLIDPFTAEDKHFED